MTNPTIEALVPTWTEQYCEALTQNYFDYHVNMLTDNSRRFSTPNDSVLGERPDLSAYAKEQLANIENGTAKLMKFRAISGKKYYKVVQQEYDENRGEYRDQSVNSFVDKKTGEIYKAASWKAPAKGVRFDMRIINERKAMHNPNCVDWASGHLYIR
tara:strand:+ start:1051 stop:1521 length:471 start_codon:yes stop_codon:yes gene_type:complete